MAKPKISQAPKIRIPESLLKELDKASERFAPGARLSRTQMVAMAIRAWLDSPARDDRWQQAYEAERGRGSK